MSRAPTRLFHTTHLFGVACGIATAVSSIHVAALGYSKREIGLLATLFGVGVVLGAPLVGQAVSRFSARWTFVVAVLGYATSLFVFPFLRSFTALGVDRFLDGICSAGVWVGSETLLLLATDDRDKANHTTQFAIWLAAGYVVGPLLSLGILQVGTTRSAFLVGGCFAVASAACGVFWLRPAQARSPDGPHPAAGHPADGAPPPTRYLSLLWKIKCSCFAAFCYGYFQAAVVLFLPLFLIESKGFSRDATVVLPGCFCLGMLLFSNLLGRLADRVGHLLTMRALAIVGLTAVAGFVWLDSYALMCLVTFVAGACLASTTPIALALQGVTTAARDMGRGNAIYNTFYAAGILGGPLLSSHIFERHGGGAMLYHLVILWSAFVVFSLVFMNDDPARAKPRTTPTSALTRPSPDREPT